MTPRLPRVSGKDVAVALKRCKFTFLHIEGVTEEKGAVRLLNIIALGGCLAGVAGLFTATGLISIKDGFVGGRIYSTFQYPNALASFLAVAFIVTLYLLLAHEEKYSMKSGKNNFFYYARKSK